MATILIVDDVPANRRVLATILGYHGHRLLEAADGREALATVHAEHPDLVITDVLMPVMDGYEFVKQLRLEPATSRIPVVFYTAHYGEREARALALSSGVAYVLAKPAGSEEVLKIVGLALSGKSEMGLPPTGSPVTADFDREHLRLVTDKLSENAGDLTAANARLKTFINIGLELASERDPDRLLQNVCLAARELFGATYVTLGIVNLGDRTVQRVVTCGTEANSWIKSGDALSGILGTVVAERRALRGFNPGGDPAGLALPSLHPKVRAFLTAPVASPAHVYGWFCLVANEGRIFTEDDEYLVTALSGQIGRIYENSYLHAVTEKRAMELEREVVVRKEAEAALLGERDRAQQYLQTAQVILLKLDLDGRIVLVNHYACSVLGWTVEELRGRDWVDTCLPARIREASRGNFRNLVGGDTSVIEDPILTKSGEERLVEWRNTLLRDEEGRVIGTLSSGADITERKRVADALGITEGRMRFALEAAGVGIWDMDYTSGKLRWSETAEAHYGVPAGTFGGTFEAFVERIHPDDRESVLEAVGKALKEGSDFSTLNRSVWPDGTVRWLSGAGRIYLGEHGEPVRGVGISLDVTDRRALETQYQQAQKMEALGQLAGGVAHDFNNLLTVILGYCELLLVDLDSDDRRRPGILRIQKAGASAAGLTRQLLTFSRKQIVEPTVLDLNAVVSDMQGMLGRLIREDVTVVLRLGPQLVRVKADRGQVEQIVMNLAVNARDAMPGGGTLTIGTANVELDEHYAKTHLAARPGSYAALTVTDTGAGMTRAVQARVFEPFFTTKEVGAGTGLGLSTVHGIVTQNGGSIAFYSEVGRGTVFKVYLPKADTAEVIGDAPPPVSRPHAGAQTVLVVEDEEGLREVTTKMLQAQGYTVLVAASAEEAVRQSGLNASIDVLLTDVVMPGASGPDLTRQLVRRRPGLKVIYMSGYTEDTIVQHEIHTAGAAFLQKPFTSEILGRTIREVLDGATGRPPAQAGAGSMSAGPSLRGDETRVETG
jgi:PAS domain S-box-containing protein